MPSNRILNMLFCNLSLTRDLDGPGLCHLGHWMRLIWLYLGDQYEVCGHGWNSIQGMANYVVFYPFKWNLASTCNLDWVIECTLPGCTLEHNMKSVGEIAFEIWPIITYLLILGTFDLDLWPWPSLKVIGVIFECALFGCTLVPSTKSVGEIAFEIWPVL